ncbi:MAG TPA: patatin-like phospholipase family protein, partial [Myxococcota bacterium]|nr:patatin-like phospholipase family protein [Myxococcota bacterium]
MVTSRAEWLAEGPFTLALSAGFFGFYAHAGVLRALGEAGLRPARLVGASAGALSGGLFASGVPIEALEAELLSLSRADFWDAGLPLGGLLRGERFGATLRRVLAPTGVDRIEACPIPFHPVVFDLVRRQTVVLRDGPLDAAIRASCALPGLFRPVSVGGRLCVDGGLRDRGGVSALAVAERTLLHHLSSTSPWRWVSGAAPQGDTTCWRTLSIPALPRVTPFALGRGREAHATARRATLDWLAQPLA